MKNKGFTLIELLIAVAIVAILAGIALPAYLNYVDRSKVKTAQVDVVSLTTVVENHRQRTLAYPTASGVGQFSSWHPSSNFDFTYEGTNVGYTITASAKDSRLKDCVVRITHNNQRTQTTACKGKTSW